MGTRGAPKPALLNNRSSRPKDSYVLANRALTASRSLTSVGTTSTCEPASPASAFASSKGSRRRPAMATEYPSFTSARAACLPTPVPPPVTIATLPFKLIPQHSFAVRVTLPRRQATTAPRIVNSAVGLPGAIETVFQPLVGRAAATTDGPSVTTSYVGGQSE